MLGGIFPATAISLVSLNYPRKTAGRVESVVSIGSQASFQAQADSLTYEPYFGLNEKPFSLIADPRFVYDSPTYVATCEGLIAGIRRREGLLVLTGEIGTGKTTLCRTVLADLGRQTYSSLVSDPFASREDLLKTLLIDFGVLSIQELTTGPLRQASRTELGFLLSDFIDSLAADAFVVVMLDEAQNLSLPLIEETRLLSDTIGAHGRLQIVFVGQPELHAKLKLPEMRQVDQRVCGYHRLAPMSRDAVAGYLQHRLLAAGGHPDRVLFPPDVVDAIHRRSGGVPRLINRVCDRALHVAFERLAEHVDREILEIALKDVGSVTLSPTWDSIVFAEPATVVPAPAPVSAPAPASPPAPAAPAAAMTPLADDEEDFSTQLDRWVAQDLAPSARPPGRVVSTEDAPAPRRRSSRSTPSRETPRVVATDWPPDVRSETYMHRLVRMWAKRAAIALAALVALSLIAGGGGALLSDGLTPSALPTPPQAPVVAVPGIAPPQTPPPDATAAVASASAEYLVAVGMFANRERADQLVETLTQAGLPAMQRPVQLRRQQVQQIVLGPFFSRSDAEADLRRLQALGGFDEARVVGSSQ
jgi:type II secretory pathway predicted ATPase ExeA/cell division septation protein DedD